MENTTDNNQKKHIKRIIYVIICCVFAIGIIYYLWKVNYYQDKFLPNTVMNGISCEELTVDQVEEQIRQQVENYEIKIDFKEGVQEVISGTDIDYKYVKDDAVKEIHQKQNPWLWIVHVFEKNEYTIETSVEFDQKKLKKEVKKLNSLQENAQIEPEDAYIVFEENSFIIVEEVYGSTIEKEVLLNALKEAVQKQQSRISVEEIGGYVLPEIAKEDELLQRQLEQLNELVKVSVTYELPDGKKVLDGNELRKWLSQDEDGNYYMDEEKFAKKLKKYVKALAEEVDTVGKERPFHTTSGLDVTVSGGSYGWKIAQKKEREALMKNIEALEIVTREPIYSSEELYTENNGLGDTYIEVNLTEQHLYYYIDGKIEVESDFVSGRMISSRYTPPGVYFLTYKEKNRVLRGRIGADGQPSYESFVNFWMPFNGGIGLHDASWRGSFGGSIYVYSGSHGCINLPYSAAKAIYERIDKKTPIVCVYNDGYKLWG